MTPAPDHLAARARIIEAWAEAHFIDPHGVVYTSLDKATGRPLTNSFFEPEAESLNIPGYTAAEFWNYEDCGMTTGAYMQAMVWRYEAERAPAALECARRCYRALKHIYDMGKQLEEGFFPKIYGARFSNQTSTDQVLYVVLALDHYAPHADKDERAEIARMIAHMIQFWVKRKYRYLYYDVPDMLWPLVRFPSLLLLAYNHSGDAQFKVEYERLLAEGVNRHPEFDYLRRKRDGEIKLSDYEKQQNAWLISNMAGYVTMDVMELDYLLRNDPSNSWAATWRQSARQMWEEARLALAPDGKAFVNVLVAMATGIPRPPDPFYVEGKPGYGWTYGRYISGAKSGLSSMIARAGVQAARHLPEREAILGDSKRILETLDVQDLTYLDQPERFLPRHRFMTRFYSGSAMADWLWAYWQGKVAGFW